MAQLLHYFVFCIWKFSESPTTIVDTFFSRQISAISSTAFSEFGKTESGKANSAFSSETASPMRFEPKSIPRYSWLHYRQNLILLPYYEHNKHTGHQPVDLSFNSAVDNSVERHRAVEVGSPVAQVVVCHNARRQHGRHFGNHLHFPHCPKYNVETMERPMPILTSRSVLPLPTLQTTVLNRKAMSARRRWPPFPKLSKPSKPKTQSFRQKKNRQKRNLQRKLNRRWIII